MQAAPMAVAATLALAAMVLAAAMAPGAVSLPAPATAALPDGGAVVAADLAGTAGSRTRPAVATADGAGVAGLAELPAAPATEHAGPALPPADRHQLALTDDQHLVPDHALRLVMTSYLSDRDNPRRLQQLDDHLRRQLPAGAAAEARALAARYDAYLAEHDALLEAQHFADEPDLHRLASWQAQRRHLRERMLGADLTEQWFGTEDAYLEQALAENQQPARTATVAERLHAQHMRAVIAAAIGRAPSAGADDSADEKKATSLRPSISAYAGN